jgi:hypothetical protein
MPQGMLTIIYMQMIQIIPIYRVKSLKKFLLSSMTVFNITSFIHILGKIASKARKSGSRLSKPRELALGKR